MAQTRKRCKLTCKLRMRVLTHVHLRGHVCQFPLHCYLARKRSDIKKEREIATFHSREKPLDKERNECLARWLLEKQSKRSEKKKVDIKRSRKIRLRKRIVCKEKKLERKKEKIRMGDSECKGRKFV